MTKPINIILLDNGSLKAEATLRLRQLAQQLSQLCARPVDAVSLRHADKIDINKLGGQPAVTFTNYLRLKLTSESVRFIVLPLFFGKSAALTSYVPQQLEILKQEFGAIDLQVAEEIYPLPEGDDRLISILVDHVQNVVAPDGTPHPPVVLVDHGSPSPQVTAVRKHIADSLSRRLSGINIDQAVMERRAGSEYDFNGPLLEQYLQQKAKEGVKNLVVLLLFFFPGRHAGKGGDIEQICARVCEKHPAMEVRLTALVAEHPDLVSLLDARLQQVLAC